MVHLEDMEELKSRVDEAIENSNILQEYCDMYFGEYYYNKKDIGEIRINEILEMMPFIEKVMWFINDDMQLNAILIDELKEIVK